MAFSKWSKKNIETYIHTYEELKKIPDLVTAGFSKLGPGTSLKYHKGWGQLSNNVLRCHLGLEVPENSCRILVKPNERETIYYRYQKENDWIIFDDSLEHSADNNSDRDRIVLILDIKRPKNVNKGTSNVTFSDELENFLKEFNLSK
jgi:aspartyl/asparaginyl beta-hydroxylase (cupin superfamily)